MVRPSLSRSIATVAVLGLVEQVDLVGGAAEDLLALVARHVDEALVDLDEAEVGQAADDGGRGIGREGLLEPLLGGEPLGGVGHHQHQAVGLARDGR